MDVTTPSNPNPGRNRGQNTACFIPTKNAKSLTVPRYEKEKAYFPNLSCLSGRREKQKIIIQRTQNPVIFPIKADIRVTLRASFSFLKCHVKLSLSHPSLVRLTKSYFSAVQLLLPACISFAFV